MSTVHLSRLFENADGTFGVLAVGRFRCFTVERPWLQNARRISCIPPGEYGMHLGRYNRGGYPAWVLDDVPGRDLIKIHRANWARELAGCIAPGKQLGYLDGRMAVISSSVAYKGLMEALHPATSARIVITATPALQAAPPPGWV